MPGHLRIESIRLTPGQEWTNQAAAWCFLHLTNGAAYWMDPVKPRSLNTGELIALAPGVTATLRASQLNAVVIHQLNFAPDLLCGFFTLAERVYFDNGEGKGSIAVRFLPSTHPSAKKIGLMIDRGELGSDVVGRAELLGLVVAFFSDRMEKLPPANGPGLTVQEKFRQIVCQMPDVELIQHTPEQLALLCGCSPRHFNRLFRQQFGESPRVRQTELRLLKARHLLAESHEKVAQVALACGYRSLSLFNSLFKRRFKMSPSEWRQRANGSCEGGSSIQT